MDISGNKQVIQVVCAMICNEKKEDKETKMGKRMDLGHAAARIFCSAERAGDK